MITQEEYNVAKQRHRELYYKVNILNYRLQVVDEISDYITNASFSIDATSDIRRTGTLTVVPKDQSYFTIQKGSRFWADKYVQVYIGIYNDELQDVTYTNMGIYLINNPSQRVSSSENTLQIQLVDMMAKMTGMRNGNLSGADYYIAQGSNIRSAIIAILTECGFTKYDIELESDAYTTTQTDITVSADGTYYDLLQQLNEFNMNYQMYFDLDGVFHYCKIPDGHNEQVRVDNDIWDCVYIEHTLDNDYESIKNKIIVLGMTHDVSYYSTTTTLSGSAYSLTVADLTTLTDGIVVGFTPTSVPSGSFTINVNSLGAKSVVDDMGNIPTLTANTYYVVYYSASSNKWIFKGKVTAYGEAEETNMNSPYCTCGTLGTIQITLQGGEYDNISSDNLAIQRAEWELYTRCKLHDTITLSCVPLYWLDVNWVASIQLPHETQAHKYIIKQVSTEGKFDAVQQVTLMRYYPLYED